LLTLDTSGLFSLLNRRDPDHDRAKKAMLEAGRPYLIPIAILAEVAYLIEQRMPNILDPFLADLESGAYSLDCGEEDVPRIRELVARYADLSLGVADAAVIALAERSGGLVLTLDVRDFGVVAREGTIQLLPVAQRG
jgi:predicted nucleic acid-binding protein